MGHNRREENKTYVHRIHVMPVDYKLYIHIHMYTPFVIGVLHSKLQHMSCDCANMYSATLGVGRWFGTAGEVDRPAPSPSYTCRRDTCRRWGESRRHPVSSYRRDPCMWQLLHLLWKVIVIAWFVRLYVEIIREL